MIAPRDETAALQNRFPAPQRPITEVSGFDNRPGALSVRNALQQHGLETEIPEFVASGSRPDLPCPEIVLILSGIRPHLRSLRGCPDLNSLLELFRSLEMISSSRALSFTEPPPVSAKGCSFGASRSTVRLPWLLKL
jgi:hypothetical protein